MFRRGIAALIYFGSMVLVLFCAIKLHSAILTLLAMIVQLGALAFYCASFIPFAQVRQSFPGPLSVCIPLHLYH